MSEFYTTESILAVWEKELLTELSDDRYDDHDPYTHGYDDEDDFEYYGYQDTEPDNEEYIDSYAEASLFGWDS